MPFTSETDAITYVFRSLRRRGTARGYDEQTRDVTPTRRLLGVTGLLDSPREYAVVTGSKGKGSTTAITAKLLQQLGHTVGMITSPHLVSYRERIRVNGRAIPEADLVRLLNELEPEIDAIEAQIEAGRYFSPQGIFLALALRWFDEQNVNAAVLEVGRGGRYDDIAVVHNLLALFTPIMLEHTNYLGDSLARIAWHKAGIIKPMGYAYSVPQAGDVLDTIQAEADGQGAQFAWIAPMDMGEYVATDDDRAPGGAGVRFRLGRYGDLKISQLGRYQVENATLAIQGAGNMHGRLSQPERVPISHGSQAYIDAMRAGLLAIRFPGRLHKLGERPTVYVDGAINGESARLMVASLDGRMPDPIIAIVCVPDDKDYTGVYREVGLAAEALILTETTRNVTLHFLDADAALAAARRFNNDVQHTRTLNEALEIARARAGSDGTILIVGTQSIVADAINLWGVSAEVI
ncbi:MAG: Mur ligase family protein [Chloroflexota bacterium]|nr:Mur ligase family protein [Chloroflexota bacterium]